MNKKSVIRLNEPFNLTKERLEPCRELTELKIRYYNENTLEKNYSMVKEMKCYFCATTFKNIDYINCITYSETFHKNCIENYLFALDNNDKKTKVNVDLVECIFCYNK